MNAVVADHLINRTMINTPRQTFVMRGGVAVCFFGVGFKTGVEDAFAATSLAFAAVVGFAAALAGRASGIGAAPGIFVFDVLQGIHAGACFTSGGIVDEGKARPMTGLSSCEERI